ncbi:MAG TPA: suppressor of fused domain protein [Solirubrobacteraceae bacterium]
MTARPGEEDEESTPDGTRVLRHEVPVEGADELSGGDPALIEAVSAHVERHLGPVGQVYHEFISPTVHVDLLEVPATGERPFQVVVTCGMAELPMRPPETMAEFTHTELFALLPPDWPLDDEALNDERNYWPLRTLKFLARVPHLFDTWLWVGHTIPNEDPPEPYAEGTELCGALLMPPMLVPEGFEVLERPDGAPIHFLLLMPLHADEMQLKLDKGLEALYDRFDAADLSPIIDPARPSTVQRRRKRFGLF